MFERRRLLAGKRQTTCLGMVRGNAAVLVAHAMAFALGRQLRGALEPLLGLGHLAAGKTFLSVPILAEPDQIGRSAHRAHHLIELVEPPVIHTCGSNPAPVDCDVAPALDSYDRARR
jgi:hypothetical protein